MQKRAVKAVTASKAHGIGFVLTGTDIAAIDIDKCRNPESGAIDAWAQDILSAIFWPWSAIFWPLSPPSRLKLTRRPKMLGYSKGNL